MVLKKEISDDLRWFRLRKRYQELEIGRVFKILRTAGIESVLIKGLVCALNYPDGEPRSIRDIDVAVSSGDFDSAAALVRGNEFSGFAVDLHKELRLLDRVPWTDLLENSRFIDVNGTPVRVLRPEDHLRVICVHWLTDGGAYKNKLWDVYYAVQNRPADFDWTRCLDVVDATRRNWIITAVAAAHEYLGLKIDDLPFFDEIRPIPRWVRRSFENEWRTNIRLQDVPPLFVAPLDCVRQVAKRVPPNPVMATIECNGQFTEESPARYQRRVLVRFFKTALASVPYLVLNQWRKRP